MLYAFQKKSRARLASPQPRPTSPVNGAGGITGCWKDARAPSVVPVLRIFFRTRLSDSPRREPGCSARVVSMVAMGRWTDRRAHYATAIQGNFHWSFECNRGFADIRRRPVCIGTRSFREPAGSLAAIHGGFGHQRGCRQPRRQNRPCAWCRGIVGADQDNLASAGGPSRYVGSGPHTNGPGAQRFFRALGDQIAGSKDGDRLRAHGQHPDRSRQAAPAGSLRDVVGALRAFPLAQPKTPSRFRRASVIACKAEFVQANQCDAFSSREPVSILLENALTLFDI
jgi:hypothetical protein